MKLNFFTLLITLFSGVSLGERIQVNPNITVDYALAFQSDVVPNKEFHNSRFPIISYDSPAFITYHTNLEDCQTQCATLDICNGIYQEWNQSLLMTTVEEIYTTNTSNISNLTWESTNVDGSKNSNSFCYLLSDVGMGYEEVNITSRSYLKIQSHNYTEALGNNTIGIYIAESMPTNAFGNATVYLDLNHNGQLDELEPNISTQTGREVYFRNLSSGLYLVRTISPDFCHQLYPGMRGDDFIFSQMGDGYVDTINTYYHHGHSNFIAPHGGYIGEPKVVANRNFSFILGSNNQTYLSFYPDNNITLGFIDETVVDDLIIEVYGESPTWAHVSVSHDNYHFYPVGILESRTTTFNLTDIELNLPVAFVRLHFMGEDPFIPINLVRIYSPQEDIRSPEFGFLVGVPVLNYNLGYYRFLIFYHDCYNEAYCEDFCYYMSNNFDLEESCLTGCNLFYETENCMCQDYESIDYVNFFGDTFNNEWCYKGCHYELGWSVGPEFVPLPDHTGVETNILPLSDTCEQYCLYNLYDMCVDDSKCNSFSYDLQNQGELFSGIQYQDSPNNYIMIRRNIFDNFTELTSTTTTTFTTTTFTSITLTSTSQTSTSTLSLTSSTLTDTSTSSSTVSTVSSTSKTLTTTSRTMTTSSVTDTSFTETTNTTTTTTDTTTDTVPISLEQQNSGSGLEPNTPSNSNSDSNKSNNQKTVIAILVSLFVVIIMGFGVIGYFIYKKRNTVVNAPEINRGMVAFDNPVYNRDFENQAQNPPQDVIYQDTDGYDPDANYLEIEE